jgi:hypothetical protein
MDNKIVTLIESGKFVQANGLLMETIDQKMLQVLEEKRKSIIAETWGKPLTESVDEKTKDKASKRKAFKTKFFDKKGK